MDTLTIGRCQIQHCVKLFDVYEDADSVHLVMENCQGDTLDTIFNFASQQDSEGSQSDEECQSDSDRDSFAEADDYNDSLEDSPSFNNERTFKRIMR